MSYFLTGNSLVEILYTCMSHIFNQASLSIIVKWTSSFLIVYALLIWQSISSATPWKWNSLVYSSFFFVQSEKNIWERFLNILEDIFGQSVLFCSFGEITLQFLFRSPSGVLEDSKPVYTYCICCHNICAQISVLWNSLSLIK